MQETEEIRRARRIIENTSQHLFLTGKAGTGKTTFLRSLAAEPPKRLVVLAPTGIAAINARGSTIHSFFQLPFSPFLPEQKLASDLFKLNKHKIRLIRSLDLVVIDEISMVRADLLDLVDTALRHYRRSAKPFGGVQLLMIGDLQQLAPVAKPEEWALLRQYYDSPYFFSSTALRKAGFLSLELTQVYRQQDEAFLALLNAVRNNCADQRVLDALNRRCIPDFQPPQGEGYIRLVTHNAQARELNRAELDRLPDKSFTYRAEIKGNFPQYSFPTDEELELKTGAQVMFVKNDPQHRYYNGSIGTVTDIGSDGFAVFLPEMGEEVQVEREVWENTRYALEKNTMEITEKVEGTFSQYPVRLAWAVTIHKSQGLTFDHAIIDAHAAFSHGQTYVALSRCRTLEGLVLSTPITAAAIINDHLVTGFSKEVSENAPSDSAIALYEKQYALLLLEELFTFEPERGAFFRLLRHAEEHFSQLFPHTLEHLRRCHEDFLTRVNAIAEKFKQQCAHLDAFDDAALLARFRKAAAYFADELSDLKDQLGQLSLISDDQKISERTDALQKEMNELLTYKLRLLTFVKNNGFDAHTYRNERTLIKMRAEEDTQPSKAKKEKTGRKRKTAETVEEKKRIIVPQDILHPELYHRLTDWRLKKARENKLPAYTVLQQKALIGIANLLPDTPQKMMLIPHCGATTVNRYGEEILQIVQEFRESRK